MKIRTAKPLDAERIASVSTVLGYDGLSTAEVAEQLIEIEALPNAIVWVCEIEGDLAGWIHAEKVTSLASRPFIEIKGLAVASTYQKRGIGTHLVQKVCDWALSYGLDVRVRTNEKRAQAVSFYTKCGFTKIKLQQVFQWSR